MIKQFQKRLKRLDAALAVAPMPDGGYRVTRGGKEVCQTRTLGDHVVTALQKGSLRRNPNVWKEHMAAVKDHNAQVERDGRKQEIEGRMELARALAFDLHSGNRVGSTRRYRGNFDNIFRKEQTTP